MTSWTALLGTMVSAEILMTVECPYPKVITINIPSWPPLLITSSSVTASSIWPRGMMATKLTAKVTTGLWFVYFTAKPAGTAKIREMVIHDANNVALNPPQTVYLLLSFVLTSLVLWSSPPGTLPSGIAREVTVALLASFSSNRTCLSTCPKVSVHRAINQYDS